MYFIASNVGILLFSLSARRNPQDLSCQVKAMKRRMSRKRTRRSRRTKRMEKMTTTKHHPAVSPLSHYSLEAALDSLRRLWRSNRTTCFLDQRCVFSQLHLMRFKHCRPLLNSNQLESTSIQSFPTTLVSQLDGDHIKAAWNPTL